MYVQYSRFVRLRADRSWRKVSSLHTPRNYGLYLAPSMQHNNIRFSETTTVLVPPTAPSTGRRWNTPRDAAANRCQRFELRVWPRHKDCLLITCRRTITPPSSIAPRMLRTNCIRFPASKNQIRTKGNKKRFSILSCNSLISSAQLVPSTALALRSSARLLALALVLALAHLPLAQHSSASDHVFPCPL